LRRPGRDEYAGHRFGVLVLDAEFIKRRHIGQSVQALLAGERERTHFAGLNKRHRAADGVAADRGESAK